MKPLVFLVGICVATATPVPSLPAADSPLSRGQILVAELRDARPVEDVEVRGWIRRRDADGHRTSIPFRYRTRTGTAAWETIYETEGGAGVPAQRLTVIHAEGQPNRYRLEGLPPSTNAPVQELTGDAAMVPFAGSDFWLADLGLEYFHWAEHRLDDEARIRMRKGRPCKVLESVNPTPGARGYTRVRSWVDRETGKPILAEAYGPGRKLLREFEIGGVTKVNGVWQLKNMEMRDLRADSVTVLEFQYEQRADAN